MATRESLWRGWRRTMGIVSESDLSSAKAWFKELWQTGYDQKAIPVARFLDYSERSVYEHGQRVGRIFRKGV